MADGSTADWSKVRITPEMAKAGADQLRRWCYGQDLEAVARDVFGAMRNAAFGKAEQLTGYGEPQAPDDPHVTTISPRVPLDWDG